MICISEVVISPGNLDFSLWFTQFFISHDVLCIEVKQAGWQYTALMYSFPNFEPVHCFISGSAYRLLRRQVRWPGIPISLRIFHSLLWSTQSTALLTRQPDFYKSRFSETDRWKRWKGQDVGKGCGVPCPPQIGHPPQISMYSPAQKLFKLHSSGFLWRLYYLGMKD